MDKIDVSILKELQLDARKPLSEVSNTVNLSLPAVSERIRKLERAKVIQRYTVILNPKKFNKDLLCFCFLVLRNKAPEENQEFFKFIRDEPDILDCYCVTGQYEYVLKIHTDSTDSLEAILSRMRNKTIAKNTSTSIVLSTTKETPSILPSIPDGD